MLRVVIVDDEQPAINLLKKLLETTGEVLCVGEYCKPSEAAKQIPLLQPDVLFLDIEMPGVSGIELAGEMLDRLSDIDIVFVTAFRNFAVDAFELNAVDYLLKPVLQENVDRAVSRLLQRRQLRGTSLQREAKVKINGFGNFEIKSAVQGELIKWRTSKVEELLAYLLYYRNTIVRKGEILDNLWPECEPRTADNNLHTTVYKLKKALKENNINISVAFSGGGYTVALGADVEYDVAVFEDFIASGKTLDNTKIDEFEKIIALYKGDYLEGKEYLWCIPERTRLQKYFSDVVKQMVYYYMHVGNYNKAEQLLAKNVEYVPYDEDAYEILLKICSLQGERQKMIRYYETISTMLQSDLDIEPRPSLKRLYESLMNQLDSE